MKRFVFLTEKVQTVQHCNMRNGYEIERHEYDPEICEECRLILETLFGGNYIYWTAEE